MCTGSGSDPEPSSNGWSRARGVVVKTLVLIGGAILLKRLTKSTTRRDHARVVSRSLTGEKVLKFLNPQCLLTTLKRFFPDSSKLLMVLKFTREQASRDPENYFNIRMMSCPAAEMVDGSQVLYLEQAFWRTPQKPFRQRLYMVKPCPKELKCDVEVSSYAIRDAEEYRNFCDRPKDQRPLPEEVIGDIGEHLTTIHLSCCGRGRRCLYEGSTSPGGFPNSWNGASYCTSDLAVLKNNEIHLWDRCFDENQNQVWGPKQGPYEFKPATYSSINESLSSLNILYQSSIDRPIQGSLILQDL
ncbi:chromophore lyase CRL, chloroplastic isoform X6 [Brassica rapa]|uniref:Chromophore lyase CRL, chloroplastic n=1 Tax=Brassica napus TaxID=3708 RepID=A0ABQ8DSS0_BRANA|nr:chromophore lyase CRL, chloroplastic isoform X5 [Brassica rapa]XP_033144699.1 chromophore lyase CRL, chloroplastic isoform X6 [Brassica rapa]KAH0932399.1 hypothetical protein HID58_009516 [Brassica napus]